MCEGGDSNLKKALIGDESPKDGNGQNANPPEPRVATVGDENDSDRKPEAVVDVVEAALAEALTAATRAGQWEVVAQIARELEARRKASSADNVVPLSANRMS